MTEYCKRCGLPKELCVCDVIDKEETLLTLRLEKRKYGKMITIIEGFENVPEEKIKSLASTLKHMLGTGGSVKDNKILLQGRQINNCKLVLNKLGWKTK